MNGSILITAFEPFGGQRVNASREVLNMLPDMIAGHKIHKAVLPVEFGDAGREVLRITEEVRPKFVFMLGEAGGRPCVTPETTAKREGGTSLYTPIPAARITGMMKEYPVSVSDDAGTYVCNDTFYIVLEGLKDSGVAADFIHVPYCQGQEKLRTADASGGEITKTIPVLETAKAAETVKRFMELAVGGLHEKDSLH